ncbi:MAG: esterase family protein [Ahniella sp.]|nr:esterase family protein [Ahniella sp.]
MTGALAWCLVLIVLFPAVVLAATSGAPVWVTQQVNAPGVAYRLFNSAAVGGQVSYHVLLPTDYNTSPARRYPVVYYLHGSNSVTAGIAPMSAAFRQAMDSGLMPPALVVFPNGLPFGMWCDAVGGAQPVESMVIPDLVAEVDTQWRTWPGPRARMVEGFSMGGYGAARMGLRWPALFGAVSMLGAGPLQLDFLIDDPNLNPIQLRRQILAEVYGNDPAVFEAQSPWRLAEGAVATLPPEYRLRQVIGSADFTVQYNRQFHDHLLALGLAHEWQELPVSVTRCRRSSERWATGSGTSTPGPWPMQMCCFAMVSSKALAQPCSLRCSLADSALSRAASSEALHGFAPRRCLVQCPQPTSMALTIFGT